LQIVGAGVALIARFIKVSLGVSLVPDSCHEILELWEGASFFTTIESQRIAVVKGSDLEAIFFLVFPNTLILVSKLKVDLRSERNGKEIEVGLVHPHHNVIYLSIMSRIDQVLKFLFGMVLRSTKQVVYLILHDFDRTLHHAGIHKSSRFRRKSLFQLDLLNSESISHSFICKGIGTVDTFKL